MTTTQREPKNIVFKLPKPKRKPQGQQGKQGQIIYIGTKVRIKAECDQNYVRQKYSKNELPMHNFISSKLNEKERKKICQ